MGCYISVQIPEYYQGHFWKLNKIYETKKIQT